MHSVYSDGGMKPAEVARKAADDGLKVVALTDHDTVMGVPEMNAECEKLGIVNVCGCELSACYEGAEIHILAYRPDLDSSDFKYIISENQKERERRQYRLTERFKREGYKISQEDVDKEVVDSRSSSHVIRAVCKRNGMDVDKAFYYFFHEKDYYEPTIRFNAFELLEGIHASKALAFLAHPMRIKLDDAEKFRFIKALAKTGLDGIEAFYKNTPDDVTKEYVALAKELDLKASCGGDVHFESASFYKNALPCLPDYFVDLDKISI